MGNAGLSWTFQIPWACIRHKGSSLASLLNLFSRGNLELRGLLFLAELQLGFISFLHIDGGLGTRQGP